MIPPLATRRQLRIGFEVSSSYQISRALGFIITRSAQLGSLSFPLATIPARYKSLTHRRLREVKIPSARFLSLKIQTRRSRKDSHPGSSEEVFVDSLYLKLLLGLAN